MSERIQRLMAGVDIVRHGTIPVGIEKARNITASFRQTEGQPHIIRTAKAFAAVVEGATLFIEDDMLLVGNPASRPWGVELTPLWGTWPQEEIDGLEQAGYVLAPDVRTEIDELNEYWRGRCLTARMTDSYDDERLWPYAQMGVVLPPFRSKEEGWGAGGLLGGGYGVHMEISQMIGTPQYDKVLTRGIPALIADIEAQLRGVRRFRDADFERVYFYQAAIIALQGVQTLIRRFAEIARRDAESASPERRAELLEIAASCARVAEGPAETFRDALQLYWFLYVSMLPSGTLGMGRLDQLLLPWYEADIAAGRITDAEVVELLAMLRLRSMEITIQGGTAHRAKWAGGSKWHNAVIGGVLADGSDATNRLSYLILDAAELCPTPHHTITMRVHDGTPSELIQRGLRLARTGLGMPCFVADASMIGFLENEGIPVELARDYDVAGSLSVTLPGRSRLVASPMFVVPRVLDIALLGGHDRRTGIVHGPTTPALTEAGDFETFLEGFRAQLDHFLGMQAEFNNVTIRSIGTRFPRPLDSVLMADGIELGVDVYQRKMPYDNANFVNLVGVVNAADALAAIRELVFERREVTAEQLLEALANDWEGAEELRERFLAAPKVGNDDDAADELAAWIYREAAASIRRFETVTGGRAIPSALTIGTTPWPAGAVTGATADGRVADDPLAEESMTPMRGRERATPWHVVASAAKVDQLEYQSTELDLRFERRALATDDELARLEELLRAYFDGGGKHLQLNVVDLEQLERAHRDPQSAPDVVVRLGGTSAYVAQLSPSLREEMLKRHYFAELPPRPEGVIIGRVHRAAS